MTTHFTTPTEIVYDRATHDYAMYLDGTLIGFARTYHDAEVTLDTLVFELMSGERVWSDLPHAGPDDLPDDAPGGDDPETGPYEIDLDALRLAVDELHLPTLGSGRVWWENVRFTWIEPILFGRVA